MPTLSINGGREPVLRALEAIPPGTFITANEIIAFVKASNEREFRIVIKSYVAFYSGDTVETSTVHNDANRRLYTSERTVPSK